MSAAAEPETDTARRDRAYVKSNVVTGVDWRNRVSAHPSDARSLGTMESNGGQAHGESDEEAGYELDDTWSTPNGQTDPNESER